MLYLMPSRLLSPMFRNLTVLDGFVLVTTRFNFENWYKKNTMNISQTSPKQSSLPTAMVWYITNRLLSLLTPNIRRFLYLQSKDSKLLERF